MNDFIILHRKNGNHLSELLINLSNVTYISPSSNGCYVYFTCPFTSNNSYGIMNTHVTESFEEIKRKLKNFKV